MSQQLPGRSSVESIELLGIGTQVTPDFVIVSTLVYRDKVEGFQIPEAHTTNLFRLS